MEKPVDSRVEVFDGIEGISRRAAEIFQEVVAGATTAKGWATVVLSGGTTPRLLYELLAREFDDAIPWQFIHFFWSDERCVLPDHEDSNYGLAWKALLCRVPVSKGNIHRIKGELPPEEAVREYERDIGAVFGSAGVPAFDLVLLGMGGDGHTASLFPSSEALQEARVSMAVHVQKLSSWRVTLTLPVINNARHVVFLISGKDKAEAFSRIHARGQRGPLLPASLVMPLHGSLTWLADQDAAAPILN